jgi:hypothetical protein
MHTASYPLERAEEAIHHLAGRLDGPPAINVAIAPGAVAPETRWPGRGGRATVSRAAWPGSQVLAEAP